MRRFRAVLVALSLVAAWTATGTAATPSQDIYFIDVEGRQATLVVTPAGESLLVDAGFPGADGTFASKPGDPLRARDAQRILAAARAAHVTRIDYLLVTHFHGDHMGGVPELAQLLPIREFVDHDDIKPEAERTSPGVLDAFAGYAAVRGRARHLTPKPGDRIPLAGLSAVVVSAGGATLTRPLAGAGRPNAACGGVGVEAQEPAENPRSTGVLFQFGRFRFLDLGDLTGAPLAALACPRDLVGPVDVYLVTHHGSDDAAEPATLAAFAPRVAIVNNGQTKGGAVLTLTALRGVAGIEDVWQLHRSATAGSANAADDRVANLDETTAHWLKLSARADGSFRITNGRTGEGTDYPARRARVASR